MKFLSTCLLVSSLIFTSAHAIEASSQQTQGSQVAFAYKLPNQNKVYGKNYDTYYHPASVLKLVTALSSLLYLGPNYQFTTKLLVQKNVVQKNKLILDKNGILHSNVIVKFTGDPTLTTEKYKALLQGLKNLGIKGIQGKFILDTSRFTGMSRAQGWSWDDLPVCFTAPSSAIILNKNCAFAKLKINGVGNKATPLIKESHPIGITSDVIAVNPKDYGGDCSLEANLFIDNKYHLKGCVPFNKKDKKQEWPLSLAIADPIKWGIDWTDKILKDLNIHASEGIEITEHPLDNTATLSQIKSKPLSDLVRFMLEKSDNLYADSISKNIAAEYYNLPATYYRASKAMRAILKQYANIDLGNAYLVDGSGLSPHNLLTAHNILDILSYINAHDNQLHLIDLLPISGKSGTLRWRASTYEAPLNGNVQAKTGSLTNVSNLAGFITTQSGARVPFVVFSNSLTYDERTRDRVKYRRIASPHYRYERYLLENIYYEKVFGRDFK